MSNIERGNQTEDLNSTGDHCKSAVSVTRREFIRSTAGAVAAATTSPTAFAGCQAWGGTRQPLNLLFIMTDQQRWDAMSCSGNSSIDTPNIDRLAEEGVRFSQNISGCPVCVPARGVMLTGRATSTTDVRRNQDQKDKALQPGPSYDQVLTSNGYKGYYHGKWHCPYNMSNAYENDVGTAGMTVEGAPTHKRIWKDFIAEHDVEKPDPKPGELTDPWSGWPYTPAPIDTWYERAMQDKRAGRVTPAPERGDRRQPDVFGYVHMPTAVWKIASDVERTIQSLEKAAEEEAPFTIHCSVGPPHAPFLNTKPYWRKYAVEVMPIPKSINDPMEGSPYRGRAQEKWRDPGNVQDFTSVYYGMVEEDDDQIGRLLDKLDELGLTENTLVVFTSDHGEMLGAHGMNSKNVFYREAVRTPLLMRLPGEIRADQVVDTPVSQVNYCSTIMDYLGQEDPVSRDGRSLRPLIEGRDGGWDVDYAVSEWRNRNNQPNLMIRTDQWKLMVAEKPDSQSLDALYNLQNDPHELRNLLHDPADRKQNTGEEQAMADRLIHWLKRISPDDVEPVKKRLQQTI